MTLTKRQKRNIRRAFRLFAFLFKAFYIIAAIVLIAWVVLSFLEVQANNWTLLDGASNQYSSWNFFTNMTECFGK